MSFETLGQQIKAKYPQYNDMSDKELGQKMVVKYPQYKDIVEQTTQPIAQPTPQSSGYEPTFPAKIGDVTSEPLRTLGNIPASGYQTAKDVASSFNPLNAIKTIGQIPGEFSGLQKEVGTQKAITSTLSEIPNQLYKIVPSSIRKLISGDTQGAEKDVVEDPVGQILPLLLAFEGIAKGVGKGAEFNDAMSKIAEPITKTGKIILKKAAKGIGAPIIAGLGITTGVGQQPIHEAFVGGKRGLSGTPFTEALRGKAEPISIVNTATEAVRALKEKRAIDYSKRLKEISKQKQSLDISPLTKKLEEQLKHYNIITDDSGNLDFSRSTIGRTEGIKDVKGVVERVRSWGTKPNDRTPIGLDILKRQLDDFYSDSGQARSFVTNINHSLKQILRKQVPGYQKMTSNYQKTSELLNDFKKTMSLGGKSAPDAIMRKLISGMKRDNEFRTQLLQSLEDIGGKEITEKIAGSLMSTLSAKGLIGRGAQIGAAGGIMSGILAPKTIAFLLATSPRLVGEFLLTLGYSTEKVHSFLRFLNEAKFLNKKIGFPKKLKGKIKLKSLIR